MSLTRHISYILKLHMHTFAFYMFLQFGEVLKTWLVLQQPCLWAQMKWQPGLLSAACHTNLLRRIKVTARSAQTLFLPKQNGCSHTASLRLDEEKYIHNVNLSNN